MVFPTDKLRFGLTCRYVKPEMVPEAMQSLGDFTLDPANPYDGDLKIYEEHIKKRAKLAKEREEKMKARRAARLAALA